MAFHEVRFPSDISLGAVGGPMRAVDIVTLASGFEQRRTRWASSKRSFNVGSGVKSLDQLAELVAFFEAREGQLHGFRYRDWTDFKSSDPSKIINFNDQVIGVGDDVNCRFELCKDYMSSLQHIKRRIVKPVEGTVRLGIGGRECAADEFDVDYSSGVVNFKTPPTLGVNVQAGFEFDVPVRFDCERLDLSLDHFEAGEIINIPLIEVFEA